MFLLHVLFRRKLLNSWISEIFYSISGSPTAVLWVARSSFSPFHSSPSLKSFKPLTGLGPKGLDVSKDMSQMLNSRGSLDGNTSWKLNPKNPTHSPCSCSQSRIRSMLDWLDNQTPKPSPWKAVLPLYHFLLIFWSKGRLEVCKHFVWYEIGQCKTQTVDCRPGVKCRLRVR